MSVKLTKAQHRCLDDMAKSGGMRKRSNGRWSVYPHGEYNSGVLWRLEERRLCSISMNERAQITAAGRLALATTPPASAAVLSPVGGDLGNAPGTQTGSDPLAD